MAGDHPKATQPTVLAVRISNLLAIAYAGCITISGKTPAKELISKLLCVSIYPAILPNVHRIIKAANAPVQAQRRRRSAMIPPLTPIQYPKGTAITAVNAARLPLTKI